MYYQLTNKETEQNEGLKEVKSRGGCDSCGAVMLEDLLPFILIDFNC